MEPSDEEFITIGRIIAPSGIKGKVKIEVLTDFPQRFTPLSTVYVNHQSMTIQGTSWHKGKAIVKLDAISNFESAQQLRGKLVQIHPVQAQSLPEGQYYHFQLLGLEVWTTRDELLGNITEVLQSTSNDNYVVHGAYGEILIPAIEDVVKSVELDKRRVTIEAIRGLLPSKKKGDN